MSTLLKVPVWIGLWLLVMAVKLPTALMGTFMVPFLYKYREVDYKDLPWWTRPWANPEDWHGALGSWGEESLPWWWIKREGRGFKSWYTYHAIRNPANGLRSYSLFSANIDPEKLRYKRNSYHGAKYWPHQIRSSGHSTAWHVTWQGFKMGMEIVHIWNAERHLVIKLGFRMEPRDVAIPKGLDLGMTNASFASKFLLYRKG